MRICCFVGLLLTSLAAWAETPFSSEIEPLLKRRCYECHSHESGKMKGGLTLDSRSGWQQGGDDGPAIVEGKPDESLLIKMVRWSDEDHQMPPKKKLPEIEIALLEKWVKSGAEDPREPVPIKRSENAESWWSLKPLIRPPLPVGGNPIDAYTDANLRRKGLQRSEPADRRTLIRRLSFDLHGLPPSPEAVAAFVADEDPAADEKLVDALLASPRYGERWARHWLDTIHFADTHGFEHDVFRPNAWRYRDYVIASFNRDTAWARFIREQLAADVFYPEESELTAALGFLGAGPYDMSAAGTAPMAYEYIDRDDLVTQTMATFVSTTANCARCHAHKFDPITQEDYFALQAVFAGIGKGDISYDLDPAVARQRRQWQQLKEAAEHSDAAVLLTVENEHFAIEWEAKRGTAEAWKPLNVDSFLAQEGTTLERLPDGSILSSGARPDKDTFTLGAALPVTELTGFRLDLLTDDSLPVRGPGRPENGNLHLTEFEVQLFRPGAAKPEKLQFTRATSDFDQAGFDVAKAIDGDLKSSWAIHPMEGKPHQAVFELAGKVAIEPGTRVTVVLKQMQGAGHLLGRFRISVTNAPTAGLRAVPAAIEEVLSVPVADRTPEQRLALAAAACRARAEEELARLPAQVEVWAAGRAAKNERGVIRLAEPRPIHLLKRGDLDKPGVEIGPGALSAIAALPSRFQLSDPKNESSRRAALADWIASPENPLTWRSIVNRVWQYHFGKGLSDTPSDFGHMGGAPSDPELLDWLAVWFRDEAKGSLKALHRLILTSATYRQSSASYTSAADVDPDNRLLWRMSRPRLDADTVRDSVLAVSGPLEARMGGPGVQHFKTTPGPQATPNLDYTVFDWSSAEASRRSIYRVVWRGIADPFMEALDFPDMGLLAPTRNFSASALQALALFNNDFMLSRCEMLAARLEPLGATPAERVRALFALVLQREPTPEETADFASLATKHGMAAACRVLLNSDEFLFVD